MIIGVSDFAKGRHFDISGYTYTTLTPDELSELVSRYWHTAIPGAGEKDLTRKVLVSVPATVHSTEAFFTPYARLTEGMLFRGYTKRRQEGEDLYREVEVVNGHLWPTEEVKFVKVVLYSVEALLENDGTRSTDADWEVVAIIASPFENEPMHPLAMARNFLEKVGGTKSHYTAQEFAEAIYYWSQRVKVR